MVSSFVVGCAEDRVVSVTPDVPWISRMVRPAFGTPTMRVGEPSSWPFLVFTASW